MSQLVEHLQVDADDSIGDIAMEQFYRCGHGAGVFKRRARSKFRTISAHELKARRFVCRICCPNDLIREVCAQWLSAKVRSVRSLRSVALPFGLLIREIREIRGFYGLGR